MAYRAGAGELFPGNLKPVMVEFLLCYYASKPYLLFLCLDDKNVCKPPSAPARIEPVGNVLQTELFRQQEQEHFC